VKTIHAVRSGTVLVNSKLMRRLRREAKANPAKAGALVLALVVAIGFWAPLVIRWCSPAAAAADGAAAPLAAAEPTAAASVESASRNASAAPAPTRAPAKATAMVPTAPWQQLMQAIKEDPRMQPTRRIAQGRDPFGPSAAELAAAKAGEQKKMKRAPPPDLLPADAGLVLNSTLVGSGRKMALIGGEPFWEGDTVPASQGSEGFRLLEIYPRQVVLERQGKRYGLEIKSTNSAGHDTPLAANLGNPRSDASLRNARPNLAAPRGGKAAAGKQSMPVSSANMNE
jgi:hypothetical protein